MAATYVKHRCRLHICSNSLLTVAKLQESQTEAPGAVQPRSVQEPSGKMTPRRLSLKALVLVVVGSLQDILLLSLTRC